MTLPKYNNEEIKYIKTKLPDGKTIGIRGWKVKEEKELLFAIEGDENTEDSKIDHIISMLKDCVDDKQKYDSVSENSIKKLAIEIRKISKGDEIKYIQGCPKCKHKFDDYVNITKEQVMKEFDSSPIIVNDRLTITMKDLDWKTSDKLFKEHDPVEGKESKFEFYFIVNSIDSFTLDGTTHTEFTPEEAEGLVDELTSEDYKKIVSEYEKRGSECYLDHKVKCMKCGTDFKVDYGDLLSFLVL